jgi:hypothetical protein
VDAVAIAEATKSKKVVQVDVEAEIDAKHLGQ